MTEFLTRVQRYVANFAITTSVFRASGSAGAMKKAIEFVASLNLSATHEGPFDEFLDYTTACLQSHLPAGWQPWGPARKALNVFLRDAAYNTFLRAEYNLALIEPALETPVDSQIARELRKSYKLPPWKGNVRLTPEQHLPYRGRPRSSAPSRHCPGPP